MVMPAGPAPITQTSKLPRRCFGRRWWRRRSFSCSGQSVAVAGSWPAAARGVKGGGVSARGVAEAGEVGGCGAAGSVEGDEADEGAGEGGVLAAAALVGDDARRRARGRTRSSAAGAVVEPLGGVGRPRRRARPGRRGAGWGGRAGRRGGRRASRRGRTSASGRGRGAASWVTARKWNLRRL